MSDPPRVFIASPRKLPKPAKVPGRVAVLDIAFAAEGTGTSFEKVTAPFLQGLGERLAVWVDHRDHALHPRYAHDPRFVLATKAQHGACPEMITPALVARVGEVNSVVCHGDVDGLMSAAKWIRGGVASYPAAEDAAAAIHTRVGGGSGLEPHCRGNHPERETREPSGQKHAGMKAQWAPKAIGNRVSQGAKTWPLRPIK